MWNSFFTSNFQLSLIGYEVSYQTKISLDLYLILFYENIFLSIK